MLSRFAKLASLLALLVSTAATLPAQFTYDSGGFEPPRFAPGPLEGQDGSSGFGPWLRASSGSSTAQVQSAVTNGGTQAVRMDRAASPTGDSRWAVPTPFTPDGSSLLRVEFSLNVLQSSGAPFGPIFGVELYGLSPENSFLLIGSLTVDAATGDVLYQSQGTGNLAETGTIVARGAFNQFAIEADFSTNLYTVYMNGSALRTEGFVDGPVASFSDAPMSTLAAGGDAASQSAAGTAYFDNYRLTVVPEPSTVALLVFGAAGGALSLYRRRRR